MKERIIDFFLGSGGAFFGIAMTPNHPVYDGLKIVVGGLCSIAFMMIGHLLIRDIKRANEKKNGTK